LINTTQKELNSKGPITGLKIYPFFLLVFLSMATLLEAQDYEVGLAGGAAYYLGDLNPGTHFKNTQVGYGVLIRYNFSDRWTVRVSGLRGTVKGSSPSSSYMPSRDLAFESPVTDISAVAEFNFFPYFTGSRKNGITPFIYAGVGVMFFKPASGGQELQPLGTEGQNAGYDGRKPYSLTQVNVPFGLGGKLSLSRKICITVFWELHKLFTDYLDDVSTTYYLDGTAINPDDPSQSLSDPSMDHQPGMKRGNASTMDWYSFSGVTLTYKFALGKGKRCRDLKGQ
jgi:hypothetical protein